ncbi:hypothetical protein [Duganella radicis]|uniref:Uncharacterized protein n=1 Tax=Duganella radicis TaxID=551988 RepID=A0A6L6PRS3_9BURK|nr:hypothetical protein [Duganella radicis]MTV40935.1 hypothetical protein [Duganella radicis]
METPTEKAYVDARLETVIEKVNGEIRAQQISNNARFDKLEQALAFGFQSMRDEVNLKLAQNEAQLQKIANEVTKSQSEIVKSQSGIIKWVVGAMFTSSALTISTVSFLLSQSAPRNNAPIVIYAQPTPPAAPAKAQP